MHADTAAHLAALLPADVLEVIFLSELDAPLAALLATLTRRCRRRRVRRLSTRVWGCRGGHGVCRWCRRRCLLCCRVNLHGGDICCWLIVRLEDGFGRQPFLFVRQCRDFSRM